MSEPAYVGFWWRFLASLVDTIVFAIVLVPIGIMLFGMPDYQAAVAVDGNDVNAAAAAMPQFSPGRWAYNNFMPAIVIIAFWIAKSATPGKMLIGAEIVDAKTGEKPSPGQFIIRYIGYILSAIVLCLGFIWVGFDARKQGWHDKLASTVVVFKPKQ